VSGLFAPEDESDAIYFSRRDSDELLGSHVEKSFLLEETLWPSVEHYLQAMQYESTDEQERVRSLASPEAAYNESKVRWLNMRWLKNRWFNKKRENWTDLRRVYLTRAVYTQCMTHEEVANRLLATGDKKLVENDQYDYYWGCGRDRRGTNMYGQVLMSVRDKLRDQSP
jgi:ribA/ribD-fused uncharacterized protein